MSVASGFRFDTEKALIPSLVEPRQQILHSNERKVPARKITFVFLRMGTSFDFKIDDRNLID
jgi:hypothetical protein